MPCTSPRVRTAVAGGVGILDGRDHGARLLPWRDHDRYACRATGIWDRARALAQKVVRSIESRSTRLQLQAGGDETTMAEARPWLLPDGF